MYQKICGNNIFLHFKHKIKNEYFSFQPLVGNKQNSQNITWHVHYKNLDLGFKTTFFLKTREFYQKIFLIFKIYFSVVPTSSTTTEHHEGQLIMKYHMFSIIPPLIDGLLRKEKNFFKCNQLNFLLKLKLQDNEVIVYRVMMYANPLLNVQAMYFTSKGHSVYYSTRG